MHGALRIAIRGNRRFAALGAFLTLFAASRESARSALVSQKSAYRAGAQIDDEEFSQSMTAYYRTYAPVRARVLEARV